MVDENDAESSSESDTDYYNIEFSCIKCGYEYNNYIESEYGFCKKCGNGRCKSCKSVCDDCGEESCFRCVTYLECCDKCTCCEYFYCDECCYAICVKCDGKYNVCVECEYQVCGNCTSKEHKNKYCLECSANHCTQCDSFPDYHNTCEECVEKIRSILEEKITSIPLDVIDLIIDMTFDTKSFVL